MPVNSQSHARHAVLEHRVDRPQRRKAISKGIPVLAVSHGHSLSRPRSPTNLDNLCTVLFPPAEPTFDFSVFVKIKGMIAGSIPFFVLLHSPLFSFFRTFIFSVAL